MTPEEIQALLPKDKPAQLDHIFYRDLRNHVSMFGASSIVKSVQSGWIVDFRGNGFPIVYKTKREATEMVNRWILATQDK